MPHGDLLDTRPLPGTGSGLRDEGVEWKVFNDTSEATVNSTDVGKEEAYVLAYRRLERRDVPAFNEPVWAYPASGTGVLTGSEP